MKNNFQIDFIGIGSPRSATSWIFRCLEDHPQICASYIKETCFFSSEDYKKGLGFYKKYYKDCLNLKVKGEFSPGYLSNSKVPFRIKKYFPEVKLIVCLRNPIEALYSLYFFRKYRGQHSYKTFEEFLKNNFSMLEEKKYYSHLKNFLNFFDKSQILILFYEDIEKKPVEFIQNIYNFLDVDNSFISSHAKERINVGEGCSVFSLSRLLYKIMRIVGKSKAGRKIINGLMTSKIKKPIDKLFEINKKSINQKSIRQSMDKKTRLWLKNYYQKEIESLEKLIERNLSFWQ